MAPRFKVIALLSASLTLSAAVGISAMAVARDRGAFAPAADEAACEPDRCTIVVKTEAGGAPSEIRRVTATLSAARTEPDGRRAVATRVASGAAVAPIE